MTARALELEAGLIRGLKAAGASLASVESCTGGLIAHRITSVPGSSEVFWGALVTYDNAAKQELARVPAELLRARGAVSPEVARALAEGGLERMRASLPEPRLLVCVSTTGIAGPGGGTPQKPVGLCHVALAASGRSTILRELRVDARLPRGRIQEEFARQALELVRDEILG